MLWTMLAVLFLLAAFTVLRRKRDYADHANEPWRASLGEEEPLDMDEIRRAEEEWKREESWSDSTDDESWR